MGGMGHLIGRCVLSILCPSSRSTAVAHATSAVGRMATLPLMPFFCQEEGLPQQQGIQHCPL